MPGAMSEEHLAVFSDISACKRPRLTCPHPVVDAQMNVTAGTDLLENVVEDLNFTLGASELGKRNPVTGCDIAADNVLGCLSPAECIVVKDLVTAGRPRQCPASLKDDGYLSSHDAAACTEKPCNVELGQSSRSDIRPHKCTLGDVESGSVIELDNDSGTSSGQESETWMRTSGGVKGLRKPCDNADEDRTKKSSTGLVAPPPPQGRVGTQIAAVPFKAAPKRLREMITQNARSSEPCFGKLLQCQLSPPPPPPPPARQPPPPLQQLGKVVLLPACSTHPPSQSSHSSLLLSESSKTRPLGSNRAFLVPGPQSSQRGVIQVSLSSEGDSEGEEPDWGTTSSREEEEEPFKTKSNGFHTSFDAVPQTSSKLFARADEKQDCGCIMELPRSAAGNPVGCAEFSPKSEERSDDLCNSNESTESCVDGYDDGDTTPEVLNSEKHLVEDSLSDSLVHDSEMRLLGSSNLISSRPPQATEEGGVRKIPVICEGTKDDSLVDIVVESSQTVPEIMCLADSMEIENLCPGSHAITELDAAMDQPHDIVSDEELRMQLQRVACTPEAEERIIMSESAMSEDCFSSTGTAWPAFTDMETSVGMCLLAEMHAAWEDLPDVDMSAGKATVMPLKRESPVAVDVEPLPKRRPRPQMTTPLKQSQSTKLHATSPNKFNNTTSMTNACILHAHDEGGAHVENSFDEECKGTQEFEGVGMKGSGLSNVACVFPLQDEHDSSEISMAPVERSQKTSLDAVEYTDSVMEGLSAAARWGFVEDLDDDEELNVELEKFEGQVRESRMFESSFGRGQADIKVEASSEEEGKESDFDTALVSTLEEVRGVKQELQNVFLESVEAPEQDGKLDDDEKVFGGAGGAGGMLDTCLNNMSDGDDDSDDVEMGDANLFFFDVEGGVKAIEDVSVGEHQPAVFPNDVYHSANRGVQPKSVGIPVIGQRKQPYPKPWNPRGRPHPWRKVSRACG